MHLWIYSMEEFASLKSLSKNDSLIIQKSDKGNSIVIIDKDDYLQSMWNILFDSSKFSEICIANEKYLSFLINTDMQITDLLKETEKKLKKLWDIHFKKLFNLGIESFKTPHNLQKVIFNYSSHVLTESEKSYFGKD